MGGPAIEVRGLRRTFENVVALDHLDLEVKRGEVFGLLGPNGAGKTTTLHLLLGLLPPDQGVAIVNGFQVTRQATQVRQSCGAILETHGLYERLTMMENLRFHAGVHGIEDATWIPRVRPLLERFGLWDRRDEAIGRFSKGMKTKAAFARAVLHDPPVLLLDEPTDGLDPRSSRDLRDALRQRAREHGTAILINTHNLTEAEQTCDRVALLEKGRIRAIGAPHELGGDEDKRVVDITGARITKKACAKLEGLAGFIAVERPDSGSLVLTLESEARAAPFVTALVKAGAQLEEVRIRRRGLEEAYLNLTRDRVPNPAGGPRPGPEGASTARTEGWEELAEQTVKARRRP